MKIQRIAASKHKEFDFPTPMYYIAKFVQTFPSVAKMLNMMESSRMKDGLAYITVDRPIYITGMARAGTTVMLEMLSQHPDVGSHRYLHMVLPYTPHLIQQIANHVPLMTKPTERVHKDGLVVTRDSPEAVEEIFWQRYFANAMDESMSSILDAHTSRPEFEAFYKEHIKKLLLDQHASRYIAKNNYNVTRMDYLLKMFPDVKFILMVRNPFSHIASLSKQDGIFREFEQNDPRLLDWTKIIGHREFGQGRVIINLGDDNKVKEIRHLWSRPATYVKGWAIYWDFVYSFVHEQLQKNTKLRKATLLIKYEELCEKPSEYIDQIIDHLELDHRKFAPIKAHYVSTLRVPTYYRTKYSETEQADIVNVTADTAAKFGYAL